MARIFAGIEGSYVFTGSRKPLSMDNLLVERW
jgi:hypothetical protein